MTKQHFCEFINMLARLDTQLRPLCGKNTPKVMTCITGQLAHFCAQDNPKFNSFQFVASAEKRLGYPVSE